MQITDAASAIAASKCWCHRNVPMRLSERGQAPEFGERPRAQRMTHPEECGWCAYPADVLIAAVSEFIEHSPDLVTMFEELPWQTQQDMVLRAQGFETRKSRSGKVPALPDLAF